MKKLSALLSFLILFTAFTCENEPLEGEFVLEDNSSSVEGTWKLTAWIGEEPIDLNNDGLESSNFLDEIDCYNNETIVLNQDQTGVSMSTSYAEFEMEIEVGTTNSFDYTINCINEIENTNFVWSKAGNIITITDEDGFSSDFTLNGNEISILIPNGFFAANEDFTVTITQDLTFIYTKQ